MDELVRGRTESGESQVIRVVVAEPRQLIHEALRALLQFHAIAVAGEWDDRPDLLRLIDQQQPDVAVVSLDGWGEHDSELLRDLPKIAGRVPTLALAAEFDSDVQAHMIERGVMGCVMKTQPAELLVKAIRKVAAGELWLDRARTATILGHLTRSRVLLDDDPDAMRIESLTPREREIVTLVTEGLKNKHIAERLTISEATVRNHLTSILDKLGVGDRFELAVYAFRRGLVPCPQPHAKSLSAKMLRGDFEAADRTARAARPAQRHVVRRR
jgi:DNA-binding NarL/FixJ family response regulator